MIYLFVVVVFFSSVGKEPIVGVANAPSLAACEAAAAEQSAIAETDPEVQGYTIKCVTAGTKT